MGLSLTSTQSKILATVSLFAAQSFGVSENNLRLINESELLHVDYLGAAMSQAIDKDHYVGFGSQNLISVGHSAQFNTKDFLQFSPTIKGIPISPDDIPEGLSLTFEITAMPLNSNSKFISWKWSSKHKAIEANALSKDGKWRCFGEAKLFEAHSMKLLRQYYIKPFTLNSVDQ